MKKPCKYLIYKAFVLRLVDLPGLEPRLTEPKSAVLPLHHRSIPNFRVAKVESFLLLANNLNKNIFFSFFLLQEAGMFCYNPIIV